MDSNSVSNRPIWLVDAPPRSTALPPTIHRIAGSRPSRSASFTSSYIVHPPLELGPGLPLPGLFEYVWIARRAIVGQQRPPGCVQAMIAPIPLVELEGIFANSVRRARVRSDLRWGAVRVLNREMGAAL